MGPTKIATLHRLHPGGRPLEGGVEQLDTPHRYFDELFGMAIGTFSGKARFAQRVKLSVPESSVKAQIEWMPATTRVACRPTTRS